MSCRCRPWIASASRGLHRGGFRPRAATIFYGFAPVTAMPKPPSVPVMKLWFTSLPLRFAARCWRLCRGHPSPVLAVDRQ